MSLNKVHLIGRLGADPEARTTNTGNNVCTLSVATSERFKSKDGEWQKRTEWHKVVLWNQQADFATAYLTKGRLVYVEGKIQTRAWEKDGEKRYATEIVAHHVNVLDSNPDRESAPPKQQRSASRPAASRPAPRAQAPDYGDDDLPF